MLPRDLTELTDGSQLYLIQCCQLISRPLKSKELESIAPAPHLPVFMFEAQAIHHQ